MKETIKNNGCPLHLIKRGIREGEIIAKIKRNSSIRSFVKIVINVTLEKLIEIKRNLQNHRT